MFSASLRISEIVESETLAMTKKARELRESGKDVISLSIGEPDFNTPLHICDAAYEAIKNGATHYPPVLGLLAFRESICRKLQRENGLDYKPDEIIVSNGAKHSIINAVLSIVNPGDEVILPAPFWVSYPTMVAYAGGVSVPLQTSVDNNYKPTAAELRAAVTPKTRLLIFSSPCNPSGSVFSTAELEEIAGVLREFPDIFVISDEIYEKINYSGPHVSLAQLPGMKDRVAVVNGLSKGYAMTGWRIGYLAGPRWLVAACEKMQGLFTSGASSVGMMAGIAALDGPPDSVESMRSEFLKRRNRTAELVSAIPGMRCNVPDGAFYVFPDVHAFFGKSYAGTTIHTAEDLCYFLLEHAGVAAVGGTAFGAPDCIRISYATDLNTIEKALNRMAEALLLLS
ncbi:MAG: pyridoxal phosphate-dependent aminotransferase [Bacteroidetes bacterium]|nr:pyridoxal phosphate-dependent aminotransferase [Bacteroidota bacterium]